MSKSIVVISILFMLSAKVPAQISAGINYSALYDDNLFRTVDQISDLMHQFQADLSFKFNAAGLRLYYQPELIMFRDNVRRNFGLQKAGLDFLKSVDQNRHLLSAGVDWTSRINRQEFDYYDYGQFSIYGSAQLDLGLLYLKAGYSFRNRSYSNLSDLSNRRHYFFAQLNKPFASGTSLILESSYGYKKFSGKQTYTTIYEEVSRGSMGRGHGHGGQWHSSDTTYYSVEQTLEAPALEQAVVLLRLAQSLHPRVGVFVQYRKQFALTKKTSFTNSLSYFQDEEIFDDPYSYASDGLSSRLTWIIPAAATLELGAGRAAKRYISEQAYSSATDTVATGGLREDSRVYLYLNFSKNFNLNRNWLKKLTASFTLNYVRNESNSYWYKFTNLVAGAGLEWRL